MLFKVKQELLNEIYKNAFAGIVGHMFVAFILISMLSGNVSNDLLFNWSLVMSTVLILRAISLVIYRHTKQDLNPNLNINKWTLIYQIGVFFTGVLWGSVTFLFADQYYPIDLHYIMLAIAFGLIGAGIATLGSIFSIYALFSIPMVSMITYDLIISDKPAHFEAGVLSIVGLLFLLYSALRHSKYSFDIIQSTNEVESTQLDIIERLGRAGEYRDNETGLHVKRMSHCSYLLALEYGFSKKDAKQILMASPMHDIGKIGIPDSILLKQEKLKKDEWEIMQTHTSIGAQILDNHNSKLLQLAAVIASCHHEKWDGSGYPKGLSGNNIPIEARIVSICDVFDALISVRPYKDAWPVDDALAHIKNESGKHFDPDLVNCFLSISNQIIKYNQKHQDTEAY